MPKECYCALDDDGHCPRCRKIVGDRMGRIVAIQVDAASRIDRIKDEIGDECQGCLLRYIDGALAEMVRKVFHTAPRAVAENQYKFMVSWLISLGVTGVPQIVRAWEDVRRERGWNLSGEEIG